MRLILLAALLLAAGAANAATLAQKAAILAAQSQGPALDVNLMAGALPAGGTFTRASGETCTDATGTLQTLGNNVPCFDHSATGAALGLRIEEQRTNSLRNPRGEGATGSTAPTDWSISLPSG